MTGRARCRRADGTSYENRTLAIYIVLVGDAAVQEFRQQQGGGQPLPPAPPGDIERAEVQGICRMAGTGEPVSGGRISLVSDKLGSASDAAWRTGPDGSFHIIVGKQKNLRSGTYEVVIQKPQPGPIPGKCEKPFGSLPGVGIECDLWPVRIHRVTLARGTPQVSVGVVEVDYAKNIDFAGRKSTGWPQPQPVRPSSRFQ